jgi:hypothetical protein
MDGNEVDALSLRDKLTRPDYDKSIPLPEHAIVVNWVICLA